MHNLTVLERGLVTVYTDEEGKQVVMGRELWTTVESKQDFSTWVKKRFEECEAVENEHFVRLHKKMEANNATVIEYVIQLDTAKEMAMLERNEVGKSVRKYFIDVEKKYKEAKLAMQNLSPQLQLLIGMELKQKQLETKFEIVDKKVDNITQIVGLSPTQWRTDGTKLICKIALMQGGFEHIANVYSEVYTLLEQRYGVQLNTRLTNIKKTQSINGVSKSKVDKLNQLDAIANDKKLIEGFVSILKELAIKYGIDAMEAN